MALRGSLVARERPILAGITSGLHIAKEGIEELLWPTRCVLCDVPGTLLCDECRLELPYIDPLDACPRCGHPHGRFACVNCNSFITKHRGLAPDERESSRGDSSYLEKGHARESRQSESREPRDLQYSWDSSGISAAEPPGELHLLEQIVSVFEFVDPCRKLITTYKDRKEIRLAGVLAELLANYINPAWIAPGDTALVVIPARKQAIRERGFDHMKEVGQKLSVLSGLPLLDILAPGERGDQRGLSASSRQKNMRNSFVPKLPAQSGRTSCFPAMQEKGISANTAPSGDMLTTGVALPANIILVDDVLTTGATLISGALTLKGMGVRRVFGLTVARLP